MNSEETIQAHARMTGPGSFYERNGGRFMHQNHMSHEEELQYVAGKRPREPWIKEPKKPRRSTMKKA